MEENGILESTSIINLFCLYYIFLSRINNQLNLLVEAWNNHAVRTTNMSERSDFTRLIYVILEILAVRDTFDDNTQPDELSGEDPIGLTVNSHSVS